VIPWWVRVNKNAGILRNNQSTEKNNANGKIDWRRMDYTLLRLDATISQPKEIHGACFIITYYCARHGVDGDCKASKGGKLRRHQEVKPKATKTFYHILFVTLFQLDCSPKAILINIGISLLFS